MIDAWPNFQSTSPTRDVYVWAKIFITSQVSQGLARVSQQLFEKNHFLYENFFKPFAVKRFFKCVSRWIERILL